MHKCEAYAGHADGGGGVRNFIHNYHSTYMYQVLLCLFIFAPACVQSGTAISEYGWSLLNFYPVLPSLPFAVTRNDEMGKVQYTGQPCYTRLVRS